MRAMKDSGVEWIGELPADWDVIKAKFIFKTSKGLSITKNDLVEVGYPVINYGQIHSKSNSGIYINKHLIKYVNNTFLDLYNDCVAKMGDFIFADTSEDYDGVGNFVYVNQENVFAGYHTIKLSPIDIDLKSRYLGYLFLTDCWRNQLRSSVYGIKVFSITQYLLRNAYVIFPPLHEQQRIADYLDKKCAEIDAIISKQHSIIEKLQEYKLSLITETVTKGLNADVEMKDSGIEWIGEFPKHWDLIKIGIVCKTSSGATPSRKQDSDFYVDNANIPWIKTLDLNDGLVYDSSEKISEIALENSSCTIMPMNTVCVAMYGGAGTIGKCGLLKIRASTNQAVCSLECSNKIIPLFLLFQILTLRKYWMKYAVGTRKDPNISQDIVNRMKIVLPPIMEQEEIAKFINLKSQKIDELIQRKQYLIDKLTEYKKSLIYEVVTGKKEV